MTWGIDRMKGTPTPSRLFAAAIVMASLAGLVFAPRPALHAAHRPGSTLHHAAAAEWNGLIRRVLDECGPADLLAEGMGGHPREIGRREGMALTTEPHLVPEKELPLPGDVFLVEGRTAFVIPGEGGPAAPAKPWVWYAPTLPGLPSQAEQWMFEKFRAAGIAIAGIDAGESYGSPAGCKAYAALYAEMTGKRGYGAKPVLLGRSRGGLMMLSWAAANPDKVAGFAGIYPVCNLASYPGVAKAAPAFGMSPEELQARLAEHNPVDRLASLAQAGVPLFAIHGDNDPVVPLEANSALLKTRYAAIGGTMQLLVPPGQGHNMWAGFFQCEELVHFVKTHAKP